MTVVIFSREDPNNYKWLIDFLHTFLWAQYVKPVLISNMSKIHPQNHTFAILYHSRNRGRVNVTDVTDALYDDELERLYRTLGKRNVIVVIDDLDINNDEEKTRILIAQPKIQRMAHELFLFTPAAKLNPDTDHVNITNKRRMREIIQAARPLTLPKDRNHLMIIRCSAIQTAIILVLVFVFTFVCLWYNFCILQW